jgi:hypothetical protein
MLGYFESGHICGLVCDISVVLMEYSLLQVKQPGSYQLIWKSWEQKIVVRIWLIISLLTSAHMNYVQLYL